MTLEEYIEVLAKHQKCNVNECLKFNCSECEFAISMDKVPTDKEILGYFEELKNLREKYKNVSEAFMKVNNSVFDTKQENQNLRWAFSHYLLDSGIRSSPKRVRIIDDYLQKARKENE